MTPASKRAIGRLDVFDSSGTRVDWGTAFLAGARLLLTAYHVVADRRRPDWTPKGTRFEVTFIRAASRAIPVAVVPVDADPELDFAALELLDDAPEDVEPIVVSPLRPDDGVAFAAWGFPRLNPIGGFDVSGRVSDSSARLDRKVPVLQLYAIEGAAPDAVMTGLSGGPCISEDRAFAIVRSFPTTDDQRVAAGTLYACPTLELVPREKLRDRLRLDPCAALPALPSDCPWPPHPYLDLLPYSENHARVFFGRCREIARLLQLALDQPGGPILLCGQTGVGKSSLLRAGLVPRAARRWSAKYGARDREKGLSATLASLVASASVSLPRLLVIDQLEEALTRPRGAEPHELRDFAFTVAKHLASEPRDRMVLSFRKEWLAEFERLFAAQGIGCPVLLVEPLTSDAILEVAMAVARDPALQRRWNLTIDQDAGQEIARSLSSDGESAIAPALQVLLTRLWNEAVARSRSQPHITIELVRSAAANGLGLGEVLDLRLSRIYAAMPQVAEGLALDVLEFHTTTLGTAETRTKAERADTYGELSTTVDALVIQLHEHFLLVDPRAEAQGASRLSHDALAPLVRARFAASGLRGQRARRVLENRRNDWNEAGTGSPLDEHDLALVETGLPQMRVPSGSEQHLLTASREKRDQHAKEEAVRSRRIRRSDIAVRTLLFVALSTLAGLGLMMRAVSERSRSLGHAAAQERLSEAQRALHARNIGGALLELAAAIETAPRGDPLRSTAMATLVNILPEAPRLVASVGPVSAAVFSERASVLVIRRPDGRLATWTLDSPHEVPSPDLPPLTGFLLLNFLDPPTVATNGQFAALVVPLNYGPDQSGPAVWRVLAWAVGNSALLVDEQLVGTAPPRAFWTRDSIFVVLASRPPAPDTEELVGWHISGGTASAPFRLSSPEMLSSPDPFSDRGAVVVGSDAHQSYQYVNLRALEAGHQYQVLPKTAVEWEVHAASSRDLSWTGPAEFLLRSRVGTYYRCSKSGCVEAMAAPTVSPPGADLRSRPPFEMVAERATPSGDRLVLSANGDLLRIPSTTRSPGTRSSPRRHRMDVTVDGKMLGVKWAPAGVRITETSVGITKLSTRCEGPFDGFRGFDSEGRYFFLDRNGVFEVHSTRGPDCATEFSVHVQPGNLSRFVLDDWRIRELMGLMFREARHITVRTPHDLEFALSGGVFWHLRLDSDARPHAEVGGHEVALPQGAGNGFLNYQALSPGGSYLVTCDPYGSVYGPFCWRIWDVRGERPYLLWGPACLDTAESAPGEFGPDGLEFVFAAEHSPLPAYLGPNHDDEWSWATRAAMAEILGFDLRDGRLVPVGTQREEVGSFQAQLRLDSARGESASERVLHGLELLRRQTR